jgi:8-oxo-dGTP pyrophosphatase MutT (NUDIX family)
VREDTEYQTPIFTLHKRWSANPETGAQAQFFVIRCPDWVNVVAETVEGEIILVKQYRHGTNDFSLEIPGGVIDEGETPEQAALRELEEETGYVAESIMPLGVVSANAAIMNNHAHSFWARGCRLLKPQALDEHEQIAVSLKSPEKLLESVRNGEIHHSIVVAAIGLWNMQR